MLIERTSRPLFQNTPGLTALEEAFARLSASVHLYDDSSKRLEKRLFDFWDFYSMVFSGVNNLNREVTARSYDFAVSINIPGLNRRVRDVTIDPISEAVEGFAIAVRQIDHMTFSFPTDGLRQRKYGALFMLVPIEVRINGAVHGRYSLSLEVQASTRLSALTFALAAAPRFIDSGSREYVDVFGLVPLENGTREKVRKSVVDTLSSTMRQIAPSIRLPPEIRRFGNPAFYSCHGGEGIVLDAQGFSPRKARFDPFHPDQGDHELSIFMSKEYLIPVITEMLQASDVSVVGIDFFRTFFKVTCYREASVSFFGGYANVKLTLVYTVRLAEPAVNGWVAEARLSEGSSYQYTLSCTVFCDDLEKALIKWVEDEVEKMKFRIFSFMDLRGSASSSRLALYPLGLVIHITEKPNA